MRRTSESQRGSVLIVSLWVIALLSLMAYGLIDRTSQAMQRDARLERRIESEALLLALTKHACARIAADENLDADHLSEAWASPLTLNAEEFLSGFEGIDPASASFRAFLSPALENGRININLAGIGMLEAAVAEAGASGAAREIALAIADWRDPDEAGDAESSYYQGLTPPYSAANTDIIRLEELLFVKGVTPALFFGEDANGNGILDPNEDDGDARPPNDNADGRLQLGLRDLFTMHGDGAVNLNGATEAVVRAVLLDATGDPGVAETLAQKLIERRRGPDGLDGTSGNRPYGSFDEIVLAISELSGGADLDAAAVLARPFGVASEHFRFRMDIRYADGSGTAAAEALIGREDDILAVLEWRDL